MYDSGARSSGSRGGVIDSRVHCRVEVVFANEVEDAGFPEVFDHRALEPCEDERDRFLSQRLDQVGEELDPGGIDVVETLRRRTPASERA